MRFIEAKSIIGKFNNVNFYRGCTHGCIYCDSRSTVYQVGDFENVAVKKDAIKIFTKEIMAFRKKVVINTGSMCDPYVPLEKELKLTRQMLEVIKEFGHGVNILTKSNLVLRDIDLIEKINKRHQACVCMTITTFDDNLCQKIERNVIPTSERFRCLKEFAKRGIPVEIWMGPILPFINDSVENMEHIVERAREIGINYIVVFDFGTTKRAGSEEFFYQCLDRYFPGIKDKYISTYGKAYNCRSLNHEKLWLRFKELCKQYGIIYNLNEVNQDLENNSKKFKQLSLFE